EVVRRRAHRSGDLGREDHLAALVADRPARDLLGDTGRIHVGRVDEVAARVEEARHDARRGRLVAAPGGVPERHGAETQIGDLEAGAAELAQLHETLPCRTRSYRRRGSRCYWRASASRWYWLHSGSGDKWISIGNAGSPRRASLSARIISSPARA